MKRRDDTTATGRSFGADSSPVRVRQLALVAMPESEDARTITLDARPVVLGRNPDGERPLVLDDGEASRSHAKVSYDAAVDAYAICDMQSRNGLIVDGVKCERALLRHGSVVRLGRSLLVFVDFALGGEDPLAPESPSLLGPSLVMQHLRGQIGLVAPRNVPVLIVGETGAGKERVAEELHRLSGRKGPMISVNCAAITEHLAES